MQRAFLLTISRAAVVAGLLTATPAFAHIDLVEPEARAHGTAASGDTAVDTNANQKSGPCGQVTNGRGSRVTTYAPGERITLRVREETPHDSYIRVSIDMDGDTFPQRPVMATPAETQEVALAAEEALPGADETLLAVVRESNNMANFEHVIEVELPDETCTSCTLQVIQFMYGASNPFYFQCADIVIAEDGGGAGGSAGAANSGSAGAGGAAGSSMIAVTTGGGSGIISAGGAAMATGGAAGAASTSSAGSSSMDDEDEPADDEGGCTLPATPGRSGAMGLLSLFALALGLVRRRR